MSYWGSKKKKKKTEEEFLLSKYSVWNNIRGPKFELTSRKQHVELYGAERSIMRTLHTYKLLLAENRFTFRYIVKLLRENIVIVLVVHCYLSNDIHCNISLNYSQ